MLSSNTFGKIQIWNKREKMENLINEDWDLSLFGNETDSDSDRDTDNVSDSKPSNGYNNEFND